MSCTLPRRRFLQALSLVLFTPVPTADAAESYVVLYFDWCPDIESALDNMSIVSNALPPEDAKSVELMRSITGAYGVIGRYKLPKAKVYTIKSRHDVLIAQETDGSDESTALVPASTVERVFNVSYGRGHNLQELKEHYAIVTTMLGPDVAKKLQIEQDSTGKYALVYKRYGDLESTQKVANHHKDLLRKSGVDASFIQEKNNTLVFNGTTVAHHPRQPSPPKANTFRDTPTDRPIRATPRDKPATSQAVASTPRPLNTQIERYIKSLRISGAVSSAEKTSWMVYDLTHGTTVAAINGDISRQAASMIKPFIMLAFFTQVAKGKIVYGSKSKSKLSAMIQRSSNSATNWTIDQLGGPSRVQKILTKNYASIFRNTNIIERIGQGGRTYKNRASAHDYVRYMKALWGNQLPSNNEQMRLLNLPGRDRIYTGAPSIPIGTAIYNKTGSTSKLCGDMGIVVANAKNGEKIAYAFVGIIERDNRVNNYSRWINSRGNVIRGVSDLTYTHLQSLYSLQ